MKLWHVMTHYKSYYSYYSYYSYHIYDISGTWKHGPRKPSRSNWCRQSRCRRPHQQKAPGDWWLGGDPKHGHWSSENVIMVKIGVQPLRLDTLRDSSLLGCQTVVKKSGKMLGNLTQMRLEPRWKWQRCADPNMLQDFMLIVTYSDI